MPTRFFVVAALCLLAACSSSPPTSGDAATTLNQVEAWLAQAKAATSPERERLQLQAAELLLDNRELDATASTLQGIDSSDFDPELHAWLIQLQAGLKLAQGDPATALARLNDADLAQIGDRIPLRRQLALGQLRARALAMTGEHFASAQERIFLAPLLPEKDREANRDALWQSLMHLDTAQLNRYHHQALSDDLRGWLALALLARDNQLGLQGQSDQFDQWLQEWPDHPAAAHPPDNLRLIRKLAAQQPTQVALLLPLSGRLQTFGIAVRDGFMAAWYEQSGQRPAVHVYDTESQDDIVALYQQAVAEGAQLVIGPLDKERVGKLQLHGTLPVPVLALNRSELSAPAPQGFYQFSLAPEDEARLLADAAAQQMYRRVLILAPNDDSSQRLLTTFTERWQELGGSVVNSLTLETPDTYSQGVVEALNLDLSKNRAAAIERMINRKVSAAPRRRQDIDFVLLLAKPQAARSLKPLLAYHYAGDLPVYATSRIYDGYPQPGLDRDLNGIVFSDIPWLLTDDPLRSAIEQNFPRQRSYLRLYALGIDSFRLYPRLEQLAQLRDSRLYGRTGDLKLNSRGEIERELGLARFAQGIPERLPRPDRSLDYRIGGPQTVGQQPLESRESSPHRNSGSRSGSVAPATQTDAGMDTGHETQPFWN